MKYMMEHDVHPTIDRIYADLLESMPTMSKATVYNTLKLFVEKKAVKSLFIDEKNVRYDAVTKLHGHFKCNKCDTIFNVPLEESDIPKFNEKSDHKLSETQIYFFGNCEKCAY
jgi:Fur family ferric uptake transcriptional regulator/Fur family peroxide stress response transcriptional regulator